MKAHIRTDELMLRGSSAGLRQAHKKVPVGWPLCLKQGLASGQCLAVGRRFTHRRARRCGEKAKDGYRRVRGWKK